ncbi:MAG: cation diffusion facilitator family transporter [Peptoniphilaceae bacterium]|nr:cation diffusion facilitator family transporter [Peptoniphilaceae bacterium]
MDERTQIGQRTSAIGLLFNLGLAGSKIFIGLATGAASIVGDGMNNLFDALSSVVSFATFVIAGKPSDRSHPFGHARFEYLSSFVVGLVILYVAVSLLMQGIDGIRHPEMIAMTPLSLAILLVSQVVKAGMVVYYTRVGKRIGSNVLLAAAADAKSDLLVTLAIIVALALAPLIHVATDGYLTVFVAVLVAKNGWDILKENVNELVGTAPDEGFVSDLTERLMHYDGVLGIHDLIVHDYGPRRRFVTVHVEVDGMRTAIESHELVDRIERELSEQKDIDITIHMDPLLPQTDSIRKLQAHVLALVQQVDPGFGMHDFRVVQTSQGRKLLFDVVVPWESRYDTRKVKAELDRRMAEAFPGDEVVVTVDRDMAVRS